MLETKKDQYFGYDVTMYRIGDDLWISNPLPDSLHLVYRFDYEKMLWMEFTCTTDTVEKEFNVYSPLLK